MFFRTLCEHVSVMCRSNTRGLVIGLFRHSFISFVLRSSSYNSMYLFQYTTDYNSTSFTMLMWSYHWWFGHPFVTFPMWEWVHYNPWYNSRYRCNHCVREWCSCTKRGFPPSPHRTWRQVDIVITRDGFQTLAAFFFSNSSNRCTSKDLQH
jgi:hypothetical protein